MSRNDRHTPSHLLALGGGGLEALLDETAAVLVATKLHHVAHQVLQLQPRQSIAAKVLEQLAAGRLPALPPRAAVPVSARAAVAGAAALLTALPLALVVVVVVALAVAMPVSAATVSVAITLRA
jgi:hypothetical protein